MIAKLTNKFAKENIFKYTCKIQSSNICQCFLATQQFCEIFKGVLIQIHASTYMLKSFDYHDGKQVMPTAFNEKCLLQFIQNKKIIGSHSIKDRVLTSEKWRSVSVWIYPWLVTICIYVYILQNVFLMLSISLLYPKKSFTNFKTARKNGSNG